MNSSLINAAVRSTRLQCLGAITACLIAFTSLAQVTDPDDPVVYSPITNESTASAVLRLCDDPWGPAIGDVFLRERPSSEAIKVVDVLVRVNSGLTEGKHGVHIHETGQCIPCSTAQGHFDPGPNSNTRPDGNHPFRAGDLINININADGAGHMMTITNRISLSDGPMSLFDEDGSAIIVHVDPDTYCPEGEVAGCAGGARAACGVILRNQAPTDTSTDDGQSQSTD